MFRNTNGNFEVKGNFELINVIYPNPPTGLSSSSITTNSAIINFTPPITPTTGYYVYNNALLLRTYVATSASMNLISLTGLSGGTSYVITMAAYNSFGTSTVSTSTSFTTLSNIPNQPSSLASSNVLSTTATISISAPSTGSTPTSYYYYSSPGISGYTSSSAYGTVPYSGTTTTLNLAGLTSSTSYTVYVASNTSGGTSSYISNSFSTTFNSLLPSGTASSGLVVYFDFTSTTCYSGTGNTFKNLIDNSNQTLRTTVNNGGTITYSSTYGLYFNNTPSTDLNLFGTSIKLNTYTVQTISLWFKMVCPASYANSDTGLSMVDLRSIPNSANPDAATGYFCEGNYGTGVPAGIGTYWKSVYLNGVATVLDWYGNNTSTNIIGTTNVINNWYNITLVGNKPITTAAAIGHLSYDNFVGSLCIKWYVAFGLVYNRELTSTEISNNYTAFLTKKNSLV